MKRLSFLLVLVFPFSLYATDPVKTYIGEERFTEAECKLDVLVDKQKSGTKVISKFSVTVTQLDDDRNPIEGDVTILWEVEHTPQGLEANEIYMEKIDENDNNTVTSFASFGDIDSGPNGNMLQFTIQKFLIKEDQFVYSYICDLHSVIEGGVTTRFVEEQDDLEPMDEPLPIDEG